MKKAELIKELASKTSLTQVQTSAVLDALADVIVNAVKADDTVTLANLGTFKLKSVAEHKGRNPQTQEEILIPASKKLVFTPTSANKNL